MKISVFFSHPSPYSDEQKRFINRLKTVLYERYDLELRTLGVTDYDAMTPLNGIKEIMMETCGTITVALRRLFIVRGDEHSADERFKDGKINHIDDQWVTSPYCQIETAMAYELGFPIIIFREDGVREEGVLEKGVVKMGIPTFDSKNLADDYLVTSEWQDLINNWIFEIKQFRKNRIKMNRFF